MAAAVFILGRMPGIERPPIVAVIPGLDGTPALLIDAGANVDCKPLQLVQFARLGRAYASGVMNIDNPRVAPD
jgi:glycerol-3-phosphate acyltransferase PlsX